MGWNKSRSLTSLNLLFHVHPCGGPEGPSTRVTTTFRWNHCASNKPRKPSEKAFKALRTTLLDLQTCAGTSNGYTKRASNKSKLNRLGRSLNTWSRQVTCSEPRTPRLSLRGKPSSSKGFFCEVCAQRLARLRSSSGKATAQAACRACRHHSAPVLTRETKTVHEVN